MHGGKYLFGLYILPLAVKFTTNNNLGIKHLIQEASA